MNTVNWTPWQRSQSRKMETKKKKKERKKKFSDKTVGKNRNSCAIVSYRLLSSPKNRGNYASYGPLSPPKEPFPLANFRFHVATAKRDTAKDSVSLFTIDIRRVGGPSWPHRGSKRSRQLPEASGTREQDTRRKAWRQAQRRALKHSPWR